MNRYNYATVCAVMVISLLGPTALHPAPVKDLDREAQASFDKREYNNAINLWLSALEMEPDNDRIQQRVEMVYEIKQKKDLSLQRSKLDYRMARDRLKQRGVDEQKKGIETGKNSLKEFVYAYKIDPNDEDLKLMMDNMKNLELEIKAAEERIKISQALAEKIEKLKKEAREEMVLEYPDYQKTLKLWKEVIRYTPNDVEAIEGKRKSEFAIENRIKFEKIREYMTKGGDLFQKKEYRLARNEFEEVLKIDPKHRDARDYVEKIKEILEENLMRNQRLEQAENFYRSGINNITNNRFDAAAEDFESCLSLIKNYKDTADRLKDIARLRKEFDEKQRAQRLERINQKFQEGIIAYTQGNYKQAIDAFVLTLSLDKKNLRAGEYLQRARDALRLLEEETIDENSSYYDIIMSLITAGKNLYNRGDFVESKKKWDGILRLFPKNKVAREYIIRCDLGISPNSKEAVVSDRVMEGKKQMEQKDYRAALKTFNIIKSIDRNYPGIDNLIAEANTKMKEGDAVNVNPADRAEINRRYQAAMNLYQAGGKDNIQKALGLFRWVVQKDPGNVKSLIIVNKIESQLRVGVGEADRQQGLTDRQRELVSRYYNSGISYYTSNNFQMAIQEWRKVLAIDPGNIKARNNIRKVLAFMER